MADLKRSSFESKRERNRHLVQSVFGCTKQLFLRRLVEFNRPDEAQLNIRRPIGFRVVSEPKHFDLESPVEGGCARAAVLAYFTGQGERGHQKLVFLSKELADLRRFFQSLIRKLCRRLGFSRADQRRLFKGLFLQPNDKYFRDCAGELPPETRQQLSLVANLEFFGNKLVSELDHHKRVKVLARDLRIKLQPRFEGNYFSPEFFELFVRLNVARLDLLTEKWPSRLGPTARAETFDKQAEVLELHFSFSELISKNLVKEVYLVRESIEIKVG